VRAVLTGSTVAATFGVARAQEAPAPAGLSGLPSRFRLRFRRDAAVARRACTQRPPPSGFSPFCNSHICRNVVRTTFKGAGMPTGAAHPARQSGSGDTRPAPGTLRPGAPAPRPGRCGHPISLGLTARREHSWRRPGTSRCVYTTSPLTAVVSFRHSATIAIATVS